MTLFGLDLNLEFWRTLTLAFVALGQTLFVLLYATFPWYKSVLGRALFGKALALGLLADVFIASRIWEFAKQDVVFVVLYALLGIGVWRQLVAFVQIKRAGSGAADR